MLASLQALTRRLPALLRRALLVLQALRVLLVRQAQAQALRLRRLRLKAQALAHKEYIMPLWPGQKPGELVTLTDAATIAVDFSRGEDFTVTLDGNRTMGAPTNVEVGQTGHFAVYQDGVTGSRTLAWNAVYQLPGGTAPTLTTTAGACDVFAYWVETASRVHVVLASSDSK